MDTSFNLEIIAADGQFYSGKCDNLVIPAIDGSYGVMVGHAPTVTAIESGEIKFRHDGEWTSVIVGDGFAEIKPENTIILVETAERPEDVDIVRATEEQQHAQEMLRQKQSIEEYYRLQAIIKRATTELKFASKRKL
jgi:F-type H+-transporting ATPase subunit epsilon